MTAQPTTQPAPPRPITLCPWLVMLGAAVLYGVTLHHWVTIGSLSLTATVTGWDWHPVPLVWRDYGTAPLFFLVTYPIRVLPVSVRPLFLNMFSALCAIVTLGLLARSVRLLAHDRTKDQRQREGGEFALLSIRTAFLPALFAVLMMAFQLTFWRDAIAASGETLDLLVFAFLIYCLLQFRISQNDKLMWVFALVYGLGVSNNWALLGFFPLFLMAVIWVKRLNFFNWRFLAQMALWGILGLLLYLLVPFLGYMKGGHEGFGALLKMEIGAQTFHIRTVPRWIILVGGLPLLFAGIFAAIQWPSFEGEVSAAGNVLNTAMFRFLHIIFLAVALSMFFDFKLSPATRLHDLPYGFLTFYYMAAIFIGYFTGFILLVFGKDPPQKWDKSRGMGRVINRVVVLLAWIAAVAAPAAILYQNVPHIKAGHNDALEQFARETLRELPAQPSVILSDDPGRLYLLEAIYQRAGKANNNILIDSQSLPHREYISYLVGRYPDLRKRLTPPEHLRRILPSGSLIDFLYRMNASYPIYYLHPSFGYYFEIFYQKPHGLVYELQPIPKNQLQAPLATVPEINSNEEVWNRLKTQLETLPALAKLDPDINSICVNYAVALDFWAVELQKAGYLKQAHARFADAIQLNPQNFIAEINQQYNEQLQKNNHQPIDSGDLVYKAFSVYHGLVPVLKLNGPTDEPGLNLQIGGIMAQGGDLRAAGGLFERRLQLLPNDANAELALAKTFVDLREPDKAMDLVQKLRANPKISKWEISRLEALADMSKNDFASAEKVLLTVQQENPGDENRLGILAEFYRVTGYKMLREGKTAEANRRFREALANIDGQLKLLTSASHHSDDATDIPDTMMRKAELEMMMRSYEAAIATLGEVIQLQPANPTALLNRAIAEVQLQKNDAAKEDYRALRKLLPQQTYVSDYGLAEIASREKDKATETRYLERYLKTAPDDSVEFQQVQARLQKLGH